MNVLIIGAVAAGTKAAAKLMREDPSASVTVLTRDETISHAACALPYYVGDVIADPAALTVNTPQRFEALTGAQVHTGMEATALDAGAKMIQARDVKTGQTHSYFYDKLVLAVGARAIVPNIPGAGLQGVFTLRTPQDAVALRGYIAQYQAQHALVAGGGFIGLETAENLKKLGLDVTVAEGADQILPDALDSEMAAHVQKHLAQKGIHVITGAPVQALEGETRVLAAQAGGQRIAAQVVVLCTGIEPNTGFLKNSGLAMTRGLIHTDCQMRTNLKDVYAAGDCALVQNRITQKPQWSPMGSSANLEGRLLAKDIGGTAQAFPGVLGTGVVQLPGMNIGRTGLTEKAARAAGYDIDTALTVTEDKMPAYPGSSLFFIKLIAQRETGRLLGLQVLGAGAVDKMVDIAVAGISLGASLSDFETMDFAYAPPFSSAVSPFVQAVHVLENKRSGALVSMTPAQYAAGMAKGYRVVDVNSQPTIRGAFFVALESVNGPVDGLDPNEKLLLVCRRGRRAYFLQSRLRRYGYANTVVLEGATLFNDVSIPGAALSPDQIAQVKALGFLFDKNTADCFNGRVITRNGKITAQQADIIAQAARRFGSGAITMTTRLTMEIQGVPYDNIEPLRAFLAENGLETGGTGSKVRPVVSCKGTTCQYGLIDTFALSEQIHERFYKGYHDVKLPHKFKIAVGGCPNNCVKPDLNDLGIVGQKIPRIDTDLCRGCKVCQIERACPMKAAQVQNGKLIVNPEICNNCGRCVGKCPFKAVEQYRSGYSIYLGGRWGKKVARGKRLETVFTSEQEVLDVIEKAILLFRDQGKTGERFSDTITRLGFENVQKQLMGDELLLHKAENLDAQKHLKGGATC